MTDETIESGISNIVGKIKEMGIELKPVPSLDHSRFQMFSDHARITQNLKGTARAQVAYESLPDTQREAIDSIFHEIGKILSGNNDATPWVKIAEFSANVSSIINVK